MSRLSVCLHVATGFNCAMEKSPNSISCHCNQPWWILHHLGTKTGKVPGYHLRHVQRKNYGKKLAFGAIRAAQCCYGNSISKLKIFENEPQNLSEHDQLCNSTLSSTENSPQMLFVVFYLPASWKRRVSKRFLRLFVARDQPSWLRFENLNFFAHAFRNGAVLMYSI